MAENGRTFVIAGAGIAGLSLALALAKFGATVLVLERNQTIQEAGAGLQISPNARRVLQRLGVDRYLGDTSFTPEAIEVYPFGSRRPALNMVLGDLIHDHFGYPYAVMHRADLAQALFQACKRFANIDILFGVSDIDLESHARGVTVSVEHKAGGHRTARPFAFIGADGVHSQIRTKYLSGPKATYSGYIGWRTLMDMDALDGLIDLQKTSLFCGPGYHCVIYPLKHRNKLNVGLFTQAPEKLADADAKPGKPRISRWHKDSKAFKKIISAGGDTWTRWPIYTVKNKSWHSGAIGLVGDAAHAMLPFQAQGAAMAIEDAALLAPLLMTESNADSAFTHFQSIRTPRIKRVAKISARNGSVFHMRWPGSFIRDLVMRTRGDTAHLGELAWLYGYDPAPEPETTTKSHS